jgi:hypothetical protein
MEVVVTKGIFAIFYQTISNKFTSEYSHEGKAEKVLRCGSSVLQSVSTTI